MNLLVQKWEVAENHNKVAEKVAEKVIVNDERVDVNVTEKVNATENVTDASQKTSQKTSQKIIDLIKEDPYISTSKMAEIIGVDRRNIARNIKKPQKQGVVRRVGPDKGGFWECIRGRRNSLLESQHKVNSSSNSR